jgi:hypothetical protein
MFLFVFLLLMPMSPQAESNLLTRKEVIAFLKGGFEAQVALSEQLRTKKEVTDLLNPYFSEKYLNLFWKENIVEEEGKYGTYGSDFALYYIPYYQFSKKTKVEIGSKEIYVYEYFPANEEGPVSYKSHYEGLLLKKIAGKWKIDQYLNEAHPKPTLKKVKKANKKKHEFFSFVRFRTLLY